jgi:CHAD domain-containing protein
VRALGPRALASADPAVPTLADDATIGDVIRAAMASSVQRMLFFDPMVRLDAPAVAIHQSRVATRRLRSDLKTFRPVLEEAWAEELRAELKRFASELGSVRDADVQSDRLERAGRELGRTDGAHAVRLVRRLRRQREERLGELLQTIDSAEHLELLDRLVVASKEPRLVPDAAAPATKSLPELVDGPWRKVRKEARRISAEATDQELHQLRIRVKRARYACEAAARALPAASGMAEGLATLQGVLGDQHDAVVAQEWLRATVAAGTSRQQAFVAGLLVAGQVKEAEAVRDSWHSAWKAVDRKKLRRWLDA